MQFLSLSLSLSLPHWRAGGWAVLCARCTGARIFSVSPGCRTVHRNVLPVVSMYWYTCLAMTPEQSATNEENLSLRSVRAKHSQEHVPLVTQSFRMTEPTYTPVARQAQMAALLNWEQMRPHAKPQSSLELCSAHGDFPVDRANLK